MIIYFKKNKNILYLLIMNMLNFILSFLISVITTNNCSDTVFGVYKFSTNLLLTLPSISLLGFESSTSRLIAQENSKSVTSNIKGASIVLVCLIYIILLIAGLLFFRFTNEKFKDYAYLRYLLPFSGIFMVNQMIVNILQGEGNTRKIAVQNLFPNIFICIFLLFYLWFLKKIFVYEVLIGIYITAYLIVVLPRIINLKCSFKDTQTNIKLIVKENIKNGSKVYYSVLFSRGIIQGIGLVGAGIYGVKAYGYYSLAVSLSGALKIVSLSFGVAKFKEYSNSHFMPKSDILLLFLTNTIIVLVFNLFIELVFFMFYPKTYSDALDFLRILSIATIFSGASDVFVKFLIGNGGGQEIIKNTIISGMAFLLIAIYFFVFNGYGIISLVISSALANFIEFGLTIISYRKYIKK